MKDLSLCGKTVRVDENGMVSLTDMWRASGERKQNRPYLFLRTDKVIDFIRTLESKAQKCALLILKGGATPGTWGHKLLAYKYASWIDPEFEVGAYTVLDKFFSGELVPRDSWQALHDYVVDERISKKLGTIHGSGLARRRCEKTELQLRHQKLLEEFQHVLEFEGLL